MSGILDFLMGGAGGNSLVDGVKQSGQQSAIMQMLGLGGAQQEGVVPAASVGQASTINPALQTQPIVPQQSGYQQPSTLAQFGDKLSNWGAGVSKASEFSRTPIGFGQVLAGGNDAMQAADDRDLKNQITKAQIGAEKSKGNDLDSMAKQALVKSNMGLPLTPQEQASLKSFDTLNQAKLSYTQDKFGNFVPQPSARSILPPDMAQPNPSGSPAPDVQGLRGYHQYLLQKAGQQ